jgi:hypothetical protein
MTFSSSHQYPRLLYGFLRGKGSDTIVILSVVHFVLRCCTLDFWTTPFAFSVSGVGVGVGVKCCCVWGMRSEYVVVLDKGL